MATDVESLLRLALAPIDPPAELEARVEQTLTSLVEMAADELEAWELSAMKDPRNWPRQAVGPAAAVVVGSAAAVGLVAVRTRSKRHRRRALSGGVVELAGRTVRDVATEARRLADESLAPLAGVRSAASNPAAPLSR
jgi:hypothetical protein